MSVTTPLPKKKLQVLTSSSDIVQQRQPVCFPLISNRLLLLLRKCGFHSLEVWKETEAPPTFQATPTLSLMTSQASVSSFARRQHVTWVQPLLFMGAVVVVVAWVQQMVFKKRPLGNK